MDSLKASNTSLLEILDSLLETGVAARGDIVLSVAGVELVYVGLGAVLASMDTIVENAKKTSHTNTIKRVDSNMQQKSESCNGK